MLTEIVPRAEWYDPSYSPILFSIIVLASFGTTALFLISLITYRRRRTIHYLLITIALGLLVVRTIVGFGTLFGIIPMTVHHLVEHSFDFLIAVLILYTVYIKGVTRNPEYSLPDPND